MKSSRVGELCCGIATSKPSLAADEWMICPASLASGDTRGYPISWVKQGEHYDEFSGRQSGSLICRSDRNAGVLKAVNQCTADEPYEVSVSAVDETFDARDYVHVDDLSFAAMPMSSVDADCNVKERPLRRINMRVFVASLPMLYA